MANAVYFTKEYVTKMIDTVFADESKTNILVNGQKFIDMKDLSRTGYILIADILLDGLSNYYTANGQNTAAGYREYEGDGENRSGFADSVLNFQYTQYKVRYKRGSQFRLDFIDNMDASMLILGNAVTEFVSKHVVPEVDETRFSAIADRCYPSVGNLVSEDPIALTGAAGEVASNGILHCINRAKTWILQHGVKADDLVCFISLEAYELLKTTNELTHFIQQADFKSSEGVSFSLQAYDGLPFIPVSNDRFYTKVNLGDHGYYPTANSKKINFILASKKAIIPLVKLEWSQVFQPNVVQNFHGFIYDFLMYHDCFIPKNKLVGAYTSVATASAAGTIANVLSVAIAKSSVSGSNTIYSIDGAYTLPAGIRGDTLRYKSSAFSEGIGDTIADNVGTVVALDEIGGYDKVTIATATTSAYFVLVSHGKVIAKSAQTTLPVNG